MTTPRANADDRWSVELRALQTDYEAGMAYAERFAREFAALVPAERVRACAMTSEEIAAIENMDEAGRIAWMCGTADAFEPLGALESPPGDEQWALDI